MLVLAVILGAAVFLYSRYTKTHYKTVFYQETSKKVNTNIRIAVISDIHNRFQFDFLANKPVPGEYDPEIRSMGGRVFVSPGLNPLHFPKYRRFVADLLHGSPVVGIEAQAAGLPCFFSDRVTDEALLSPGAHRISLEADNAEWAREILAARQPEAERTQGIEIVRQAGYDIHTEARKLQEMYLEMTARAYPGKQPQP